MKQLPKDADHILMRDQSPSLSQQAQSIVCQGSFNYVWLLSSNRAQGLNQVLYRQLCYATMW